MRAKQKSYTINENLLGLTMSGGEIDLVGSGRGRPWLVRAARWPVEPLRVTVLQERRGGQPGRTARRRRRAAGELNALFAPYGVGRGVYTRTP